MRISWRAAVVGALLLLSGGVGMHAQAVASLDNIYNQEGLDRAITALDAQLFDAYNTCNLEKFSSLIAEDVEFYHDQGGITLGNKALTESVKQNVCGKTHRELVKESLKIYYMKGYGAVETGTHRFTHPGQEQLGVGEGKFIHLWRYQDGAWKIARAISFDHHSVK